MGEIINKFKMKIIIFAIFVFLLNIFDQSCASGTLGKPACRETGEIRPNSGTTIVNHPSRTGRNDCGGTRVTGENMSSGRKTSPVKIHPSPTPCNNNDDGNCGGNSNGGCDNNGGTGIHESPANGLIGLLGFNWIDDEKN